MSGSRRISTSTGLVVIFVLLMITGLGNIVMFHLLHDNESASKFHPHLNIDEKSGGKQPIKNDLSTNSFAKKSADDVKDLHANSAVKKEIKNEENIHKIMATDMGDHHPIAGLSCKDHGGPDDESASEMVFWSDIPSDSSYKSPFYDAEKYITFEPDHGGWNNIRMAYETLLVMAHAMGRTLVLPPKQK